MTLPRACITGTGMSDIGRNTGRPAMLHLAEAADRALARAGLTRDQIDGICTYPGKAENSPGMSPLGTGEVRGALGLKTRWHSAVLSIAAAVIGWSIPSAASKVRRARE